MKIRQIIVMALIVICSSEFTLAVEGHSPVMAPTGIYGYSMSEFKIVDLDCPKAGAPKEYYGSLDIVAGSNPNATHQLAVTPPLCKILSANKDQVKNLYMAHSQSGDGLSYLVGFGYSDQKKGNTAYVFAKSSGEEIQVLRKIDVIKYVPLKCDSPISDVQFKLVEGGLQNFKTCPWICRGGQIQSTDRRAIFVSDAEPDYVLVVLGGFCGSGGTGRCDVTYDSKLLR